MVVSHAPDADTISNLSNQDEAPAAGGAQRKTAAAETGDSEATHVGRDPSPEELARPSSEADVRRVYLDAASMGYVINGVGPITGLIATALILSDSQAGLHSVALAIGIISAGFATARLDMVIGTAKIHLAALVMLGVAFFLLALAPALVVTLLAAAAVGLAFGMMFAHVNQTLTAGGGALARVRTARGTLVAQIAGLTLPIVIGIGVAIGVGWGFAAVPVIILVALSMYFTRGRNYRPIMRSSEGGRLPKAYWMAWLFLVTISSFESAIMFWASPLVARQAGIPVEEALIVISAFLGGMVLSRFGLSLPAVGRADPIWIIRVGLAIVIVGAVVAWASTSLALSAVAFFFAGFGAGVMFPLAITMAMDTSPLQPQLASSRVVLGPGLGLLIMPFVLGVLADATEVGVAWFIVPALGLAAVALTIPVARDRRAASAEAAAA